MAESAAAARAAALRSKSGRCSVRSWLLGVAMLCATPIASAQFVSVCGSAPSGTNSCPWYHVEIVIFHNDTGGSAERLVGDATPRLAPRLAMLKPQPDEYIRPTRTAELLALWQSADEAAEWLLVSPGLSVEEERFLIAIETIGRPRHPVDLSFLDTLHELAWSEFDAPDPEAIAEPDPDTVPIPALEPVVVIAQPWPESEPDLEVVELPELVGIIPMDLAFREVPPRERLLNPEAARLQRTRGYRVLAHKAWRQPFVPNEPGLAQLIYTADLAESGLPNGELLLGTVRIDLRRFLHAHLDLYFRPEARFDIAGDLIPEDHGKWIQVRQSRRMRSGELHYLDHPRIGAIIRIERFELADEP